MPEPRSKKQPKAGRSAKSAPAGTRTKKYLSPQMDLSGIQAGFTRADLEFEGLDHAGASFEARVFFNNPEASEATEKTLAQGYAGSFYLFGHGGCFGDFGHCEVHGLPRPYDPRPSNPLLPIKKTLIATEAVRRALAQSPNLRVTVIPVITGMTEKCELADVLKFERLSIVTYQ
ncbi:MAG TPA: hypothetical protein VOA87_07240 [Thermoanaerobaculia bacterium]|nr:hypothetical protein [Thermoanaerobaculia bacterium]